MPSPDWRDQVVYFAMIDRFDDGDPANNDQGTGEYDPADGRKYSGGDLAGVQRRLDYIQGLGATALWLTPPVANQWWDERVAYGGYHGYWADDFTAIDAHFGALADYRGLSRALHGRGMYLVHDVVLNHMGNFFAYDASRDAGDPARGYVPGSAHRGRHAPSQSPFDLNDPRRAADRAAAIYHWTPPIGDYGDANQVLNWQLADLDDLNTDNPAVRAALRRSYGYWIREAGIDAMRIDTAFYVPTSLFPDFLDADDAQAPGVLRVAASTGRQRFEVFGEGFALDRPFEEKAARRIDGYLQGKAGQRMTGMINFPLYGTTGDVFARGHAPAELAWRIESTLRVFREPHRLPTFVDNHDVARFLADGNTAGLQQALLLILTLPGIPTIYYGTEQGLKGQRDAMFAAGFGSGGRDRFDTASPMYRYVARAVALRRGHRVLSRGLPRVLAANAAGPGVIAYRMDDGAASMLVALNTADAPRLMTVRDSGYAAGSSLTPVFSIDGRTLPPLAVGEGGSLAMTLPARAGIAWQAAPVTDDESSRAATARAAPPMTLRVPAHVPGDVDVIVRGTTAPGATVLLVVDGDLPNARRSTADDGGRWATTVDTTTMLDPDVRHDVVAWSPASGDFAGPLAMRATPRWSLLAEASDPAGDDRGPRGTYGYPTDAGFRHHQLDLRHVRVEGSRGALRITLTMRAVTNEWMGPNGFDHVAFAMYLGLPGRDGGAMAMPLQNASVPGGFRWHYRLRAHGWSNALFAATGADAVNEGTPIAPGATVRVDRERQQVVFTLPASALGSPATWRGTRLYVSTWDLDGNPRELKPEPSKHAFSGGDGTRDPLVMDDTAVITLR